MTNCVRVAEDLGIPPLPEDMVVGEPVYLVPFLPSHSKVVKAALDLANVGEEDIFVDLGAGDGRVVIEAAKRGAFAVGVEIREDLIKKARKRIAKEGLDGKARIVMGDLFRFEWIQNATVIYIFLDSEAMPKLKPLLQNKARQEARIVSITYPIPGWEPQKTIKVATFFETRTIYLYKPPQTKQEQTPLENTLQVKPEPETKQQEKIVEELTEENIRQALEKIAQKYGIKLTPSMTLREEMQAILQNKQIPQQTKTRLLKKLQEYEEKLYREG